MLIWTLLSALLAALVAGELLARWLGLVDSPLFVPDERAGYHARPSQQGCFMRRYDWSFDAHGMRAVDAIEELVGTALVIGDSVVEGGNRIAQGETLAARLQQATGERIYPLACRGWALANALAALEYVPRWQHAKRLVLVLNKGDFDTVGSMRDTFAFPTRHPTLALPWLVRKRWRRLTGAKVVDPVLPQCRAQNLAHFARLAAQFTGKIVILRYPLKDEGPEPDPYFREFCAAAPGSALIDLAHSSELGPDCYVDHIHPTAKGVAVLARFIAREAF